MHAVEASRRDDCRLEVPAPSGLQAQRRPCPLPPAPPFVRVRGTDFVTVAWYTPVSPRGGDGESSSLSYQVSFSADGNSVARRGWKRCYEGADEMCTILGLAPGRQYRVRVLALNSAGASGFSGVSFCSTAPGPPDAPSAPAAHAATSSSVVLKWTSPDHDGGSSVGRYRLEMRRLDIAQSTEGELAGAEFELVYEGRRPEFSSRGLQPGKTYECRVQAVNKFGEGIWSASSKFSTDWRADRDQPSALIDLEAPASHAPTVHSHDEGKPEDASVAVIPVLLPPAPQLVRGSQSLKLRGKLLIRGVIVKLPPLTPCKNLNVWKGTSAMTPGNSQSLFQDRCGRMCAQDRIRSLWLLVWNPTVHILVGYWRIVSPVLLCPVR